MRRRTTDLAIHRFRSGVNATHAARPTDTTVGRFLVDLDTDACEAWTACRSLIVSIAARSEWRSELCDDLVHDVISRMFDGDHRVLRRADPATPMSAWLRRVIRNLRLEAARDRRLRDIAQTRADRAEAMDAIDRAVDAVDGRSILERARGILPSPYREIIVWRWSAQRSRSAIASTLRSWGGIGPDEARRLQREADRMLRCIANGGDPRAQWPLRFAKKNRWEDAPRGHPESLSGVQSNLQQER